MGIDASTGEFIVFLDSDDRWLPTKPQRQLEIINNGANIACVYCDSEAIDGTTGETIFRRSKVFGTNSGDIQIRLFQWHFLATPTKIARREIFKELGRFWPSPKATDRDMWLRIASSYPIAYVPEVLMRHCLQHLRGVTAEMSGDQSSEAGLAVIARALVRDSIKEPPFNSMGN